MAKRLFDIIVALTGLVLLSPLFLVIAILVKLDSRGPVFYGGKRSGQFGKTFTMYKFRSMVVDADRRGPSVTIGNDSRITRTGRFLRLTKLDEFPQLWNVLKGEMSLVGPRPESVYYYERYTDEQKQIFRAKPGMTGITQVKFRNEEAMLTDPENVDRDYLEVILPPKVALDLDYIRNHSFRLDMQIIFETLWTIVKDRLFKEKSVPATGPEAAE